MALKRWFKCSLIAAALCVSASTAAWVASPCTPYPFTAFCTPLSAAALNSSFFTVYAAISAVSSALTATGGTPVSYGADPTGGADSTTALNSWLASATASNPTLTCNAGTYKFTSTLTMPTTLNNFSIRGAGSTQCFFKYAGASTSIDLITGGNTSTNTSGWNLSGFRIASDTTMTAGTALHLKRMSQAVVKDVYTDCTDQTSGHLLWNGFWFEGIHEVALRGFCAYGGHNGVQVSGVDGSSGNGFWLSDGHADLNGNAGLVLGGRAGTIWVDNVEFIGNGGATTGAQIQVDNSLIGTGCSGCVGLILSDTVHADGLQTNGQYVIEINDTVSGGGVITSNATIGSATKDNIKITSWPSGTVGLNGRNFNAIRDGVRIDDATTYLTIGGSNSIDTNGGFGVNATAATTRIISSARTFGNTSGDYSTNTGLVNPYAAAVAYTPVVTCGSAGPVTSYTATGFAMPVANTKLEQVSGTIAVTTNGTCATSLKVTLPTTAKRSTSVAVGRETAVFRTGLVGTLTATSNIMAIVTVTNAYPSDNGANVQFNFTYERE